MNTQSNLKRQFLIGVVTVATVAALCFPFVEIIGYQSVAMILLLSVSILAMRLSLYPVLLAAFLSALTWDYFFIPPHFTFQVSSYQDGLMLSMYFIVALVNGVLTARIRFFEKIARERETKARTLELYSTLFDALSHELRTPISTILGASDNLVSEESNLAERDKQKLSLEINMAAERLERLSNNLLSLSRLESGFLQPKMDWCDVQELVYTVVNRHAVALKDHPVKINLPEEIPLVKLDFGLMEQVLDNLLLNAAKHTEEGAIIYIWANCQNNVFTVSVSDTGSGFSEEQLPRVFEKFQRISPGKHSGIGLGLSIVKGFVEAQGGTVAVGNIPGSGACFTIEIPVETNNLTAGNDE